MTKKLKLFLAHASEDKEQVKAIYHRLKDSGFEPWLDEYDLLPGQNWRVEIPRVIRESDIFIACLSKNSVTKQGYVQREFRLALDACAEKPAETIYLIPLKLDDSEVPNLQLPQLGINLRDYHWLNYWEDNGFENLLRSLSGLANKSRNNFIIQAGLKPTKLFKDKTRASKIFKSLIYLSVGIILLIIGFQIVNWRNSSANLITENAPITSDTVTLTQASQPDSPVPTLTSPPHTETPSAAQNDISISKENINSLSKYKLLDWTPSGFGEISFSASGDLVAISSINGADIYDTSTWEKIRHIETKSGIWRVSFHPTEKTLALGSNEGDIFFFNISDGKRVGEILDAQEYSVDDFSYSNNGDYLVSGSGGDGGRIWSSKTNELLFKLGEMTGWGMNVAVSPNNTLIATTSFSPGINIWKLEDGSWVGALPKIAYSIEFIENGAKLLSLSSEDDGFQIWDIASLTLDRSFGNSSDLGECMSISNDEKLIAACYGTTMKILDMDTGEVLKELYSSDLNEFIAVKFSPDNQYLVAGTTYGTIMIWAVR
jgi:WD40 repeat protein